MDFNLTPEEKRLKEQFVEFFEKEMANAPEGYYGSDDIYINDENWAFHKEVARKLGEKGWLTLAWPEEYGGLNASTTSQMLFNEIAGYYLAPGVDMVGVKMIGPVIYLLGTEEQKEEHLKPIAKGERFWCQGWSEPDAGSDLAALTTTGIRDGEYYVVNGQKVWTTGAHCTDWIFLLVRSDPESKRSKGLTFLLADMKTPGISVKPIPMMNGHVHFNEVFLDNVKIPVKNRLGDEHQGWKVTRTLSNFERAGAVPVSAVERLIEYLIQYCKETRRNGDYLINDEIVRDKLMKLISEVEVGKALLNQITTFHDEKDFAKSIGVSSAAKVFISELYQRVVNTGCNIMGPFCQLKFGSRWAPIRGMFENHYQFVISHNIAGGSSEIQRNLIAWAELGLPR